jgi:hypothetical protein
MRFCFFRLYCIVFMAWVVSAAVAGAQQMPPAEPPLPLPKAHTEATTLRVTANEVLVPTLVEKPGGGVIYGLKQQDFVLEDNGVPQKIRVQEEMDTAPVALVVAVGAGRRERARIRQAGQAGPAAGSVSCRRQGPGGAGGL